MNGPDKTTGLSQNSTRSCRTDGCPCQDSRIVSHRRAAFFAAVAHANGETADRRISPERGWRMPADAIAD